MPDPLAWVADPKSVSLWAATAWAITTLGGVFAFGSPPTSIANELGPWITTAWAVLFILGGTLAVAGALPGWWYVERAGIILLATGLAVYDGVIWTLHFTTPGNRAVQGSVVLALIAMSFARYARIRGATLDPGRGPHAHPRRD